MTTVSAHAASVNKTALSSTGTVNVIRGLEDPFYRYRMEPLKTKIEGNGNGIKTVLTNMDNIGKSLNRPPSYPTKYFGCELGAQTRFDDKTARYIVNGAHEAAKLSELLDEFIKKFVLCPSCNNPETDLLIDKNNDIIRACKACGQRNFVDMRHKLTTFIVNNPPPGAKKDVAAASSSSSSSSRKQKDLAVGAGKKRDKKDKSHVAGSVVAPGKRRPSDSASDSEPDIEAPPDTHHGAGDALNEGGGDDDWADDVDDEAVSRRNRDVDLLNEKLDRLNASGGSDDDIANPAKQLFDALVRLKGSPEQAYAREIDASELGTRRGDKVALVLSSALFDDDQLSPHWIAKYTSLLKRYATDAKAQRNVLIGLERALAHRLALVAKVPILFKTLYDADVVDEEVFIKWSKKLCSRRYVARDVTKLVHEKAQVFIQWLETAEEESSSDGGDGDDANANDDDDDEEEDDSSSSPRVSDSARSSA